MPLFPQSEIRKILFLRNDAIGDALLATSMLPHLQAAYPDAEIYVACKKNVAELFESSALVKKVISYEHPRIIQDGEYLLGIIKELESIKADLAINSAYSREGLGDHLIKVSNARYRLAHEGDLSNDTPELRAQHNQTYTNLIPSTGPFKHELERHKDLLAGIGITPKTLSPIVWTTDAEELAAQKYFLEQRLDRNRTIAFFPCSQWAIKEYNNFSEALSPIVSELGATIIGLGAPDERERVESILKTLPGTHVNLSGTLSLRGCAAILRRVRLAVGVDTALAHLACGVWTQNVVVLGGGHFGRFFPYSPLTSLVTAPLSCFQCNWECRFERPHCIADIPPALIRRAIEEAFEARSETPRVYGAHLKETPMGVSGIDPMSYTAGIKCEYFPAAL